MSRGSNEVDSGQFNRSETVFGGTGACLLLHRSFVEELLLVGENHERDSEKIYPQLSENREKRAPLFDEAFFAYREDADLAWRASLLGWKCLYVPEAIGYHRRLVLPSNRSELPDEVNNCSVRNRFLLQLNNYSFLKWPAAFLPGVVIRNLIVLFAVLIIERSSLSAFRDLGILWKRASERRRILKLRLNGITG